MNKIVSEDAVRRAFAAIDEDDGAVCCDGISIIGSAPLLAEPWILDIDTTVKPLYGHQEGAVIGYNPKKPGRPSHSYHTYSMAGVRLVLDVDVVAGNEHTSNIRAPCGRCSIASRVICGRLCCVATAGSATSDHARSGTARLAYLFKLRLTANVKRMIERLSTQRSGEHRARLAGQGEPITARGVEQAAPVIYCAAGEGDLAIFRMRRQASKHCLSSMWRRRRRLRIFRSRHIARRGACEFRPAVSRSRR